MKKLITLILFLYSIIIIGQIKIGDNPNSINPNSILEIESTNKGLLLPRVTLTSTTASAPLSSHTAGMSIYNTATTGDVTPGFYYNDGTQWIKIADANSEDKDWNKELTINSPTSINDNIYTMGNVGIGLNNPSHALEINDGNIELDLNYAIGRANGSASDEYVIYPYRNGLQSLGQFGANSTYDVGLSIESDAIIAFVETDGNNLIGFMDLNSDNFIWDGNIGIKTTSPSRDLVLGNDVIMLSSVNNVTTTADIFFKESANLAAQGSFHVMLDSDNDNSDTRYFSISKNSEGTTGATELIRLHEDGNLTLQNGSIILNSRSQYGGDFPTDNNNYNNVLAIGGIGAETGLKIYKQNSGSSGTFLGSQNYLDAYVFEMTDGNNSDPDGGIVFGETGSDDTFESIMVIRGNKRIGMGVTNPGYKLDLPNTASNTIGRARANAWTTYSDKRIKRDIKAINYGLNSIMNLAPKTYFQQNSKADSSGVEIYNDGEQNIGFIAQELHKVIPEAAFKPNDEKIDLWSVDYTRLIPVLTKAIQEQQEQIEKLKKEIELIKSN